MIINKHVLVKHGDEGNGYHGTCLHCGAVLETDLGYCSWEGLKCIDRVVTDYMDFPPLIRNYARWHNLVWDKERMVFCKPYTDAEYTIDQLDEFIQSITVNTDRNS